MTHTNVVILGAGPAGATAGLLLARRHRVIVVDRVSTPAPRIGESLVPASRRLLRDFGILAEFENEGHSPYLGNRSSWGGEESEVDFLADPDGPGWHLDRARFETFLRAQASQHGAEIIAPARLSAVRKENDCWRLDIEKAGVRREIAADFVIDAGGRGAPLAHRLGATHVASDRLVACWIRGIASRHDPATSGFSVVESEEGGWWYAAPVPSAASDFAWVLAFHTDSDLIPDWARDGESLLHRARALPKIGAALSLVGIERQGDLNTTVANSSRLNPVSGTSWLAVGDAAISFDPLASRGLFNALYTALKASTACDKWLTQSDDCSDYASDIDNIHASYLQHLAYSYAAETRWPHSPFWQRRLLLEKKIRDIIIFNSELSSLLP